MSNPDQAVIAAVLIDKDGVPLPHTARRSIQSCLDEAKLLLPEDLTKLFESGLRVATCKIQVNDILPVEKTKDFLTDPPLQPLYQPDVSKRLAVMETLQGLLTMPDEFIRSVLPYVFENGIKGINEFSQLVDKSLEMGALDVTLLYRDHLEPKLFMLVQKDGDYYSLGHDGELYIDVSFRQIEGVLYYQGSDNLSEFFEDGLTFNSQTFEVTSVLNLSGE